MFIHNTPYSNSVGCISITAEWVIWHRFIEIIFIPDETKGASALWKAIENDVSDGNSIHGAAKAYGTPYSTLRYHVQLNKTGWAHSGYVENQDVYIKQAAEIAMDMTGDEVRKFAFQCGVYFKINMLGSWIVEETAGKKT